MREILNGAVMSVSTKYSHARKKAISEVEIDAEGVKDILVLEGDKFSGKDHLVGKPVRIIVEVDE